ncbi:formyltransferase family protein [Alsobacter sp. KACC 23698]|uniref:Formyltransferase family protein n=1 Tax=Alsobacter sp. KACC 23698 TaxID=3149229 RepID=A0AAU7JIF1_9HYPH
MRVALIGSRWFAARVLDILLDRGDEVFVIGTNGEDQLGKLAIEKGAPHRLLDNPKRVGADLLPGGPFDAMIAAHCHAFIDADARARAKEAFGYHPSLLPRHRGIAAVEWTIKARDPIAGGSIYHLADGWDDGLVGEQEWCFVYPDDDAGSLWKRELAPMGLRLIRRALETIEATGELPGHAQDPKAVTLAPLSGL